MSNPTPPLLPKKNIARPTPRRSGWQLIKNCSVHTRPLPVAFCRRFLIWAWVHEPEAVAKIVLQLFAGLRAWEIADASWEDIDWDNATIRIESRQMSVPLHCALDWLSFMGMRMSRGLIAPPSRRLFQSYARCNGYWKTSLHSGSLRYTFFHYCVPHTLATRLRAPSRERLYKRKGMLLQQLTPKIVLSGAVGGKNSLEAPEESAITTTDIQLV